MIACAARFIRSGRRCTTRVGPSSPAMTDTQSSGTSRTATPEREAPTAWVGWILFAGMMLILVGTFQFIAGLVALFNDDYYLVTSSQLVVHMSYTGWGWVHLLLGVLSMAAGYGVMAGK